LITQARRQSLAAMADGKHVQGKSRAELKLA